MHYYCQGCHSGENWRLFSINCIYVGTLYLVFNFITSIQFVNLAFRSGKRHKEVLYALPYFLLFFSSASLFQGGGGRRGNYPKWNLALPPKCCTEFHDHHVKSSSEVLLKVVCVAFFFWKELRAQVLIIEFTVHQNTSATTETQRLGVVWVKWSSKLGDLAFMRTSTGNGFCFILFLKIVNSVV